jgi:hypothetical protein
MDLIAKLSIYRLESLPSQSLPPAVSSVSSQSVTIATPPSAYCVVYLVGRDGQVIESIGNKTIPIKSCQPIWNIDFLLHTPLGISEIESVLIKVKDASIGTFRHKHLGQVELPIDIFLPTHPPAQLRLPLMPTERMATGGGGGYNDSLGEILLGTQLVKIPKANVSTATNQNAPSKPTLKSMLFLSVDPSPLPPPPSTTPEIKNISQQHSHHRATTTHTHFLTSHKLSLRSFSVDENDDQRQHDQPHSEPAPGGGMVKFKTELKKASPSFVWWPCLGLSSEIIPDQTIDPSSGAPGRTDGLTASRLTSEENASQWDDRECLFALDEFVIRRRIGKGDEGNLKKKDRVVQGSQDDHEELEDYIRVPWSQVSLDSSIK